MSREQQSLWDFSGSPDVGKTRRVYGVSELNREVKGILEKRLGTVWVVGQVTGLRQQASGHIYFSIKDEDGQLSCALFRGVDAEKHSLLEDGVQLVLQAKVTVFEPRGQYQLIVRKLDLQGQGELQVRFEKLKHKLKSEGLFESERKRPLPSFPARLGLVTSPTGAAIRDVLHVVQRRNPSLQIVLGPCRVQGDGAAVEMAKAIQQLNLWSAGQVDGKALDLILLTRGGGSLEDLWAFNEEVLARAVHQSELPVVSAVGHEIDFLITDFVGDVRASTPSVAAELITQDVFASRGSLGDAAIQLSRLVKRRVSLDKRNLLALSHRLGRAHPRRALDDSYQRLGNQYDDLNRLTREGVAIRRASLSLARQRLASLRPAALLLQRREQLTWLQHRLDDVQRHKLEEHCARFRGVLSRLELLSPKAVLSRGYSITCDAKTGAVLRDARKAKSGQVLRTQLHNGDISSTVNPSDTSC